MPVFVSSVSGTLNRVLFAPYVLLNARYNVGTEDIAPDIIKGDHIKTNEMDTACGTYGGQENYLRGFGGETHKIVTRNSLTYMGKIGEKGLGWIKLAQNLDPLCAHVNVIINGFVP